MNRPGYRRGRRWNRLEVAIWISALIAVTTAAILVATKVVGPWLLIVSAALVIVLGLNRYRVEAEQADRNPDDRER